MAIKKIAVIQDLSSYGRASLTVTIPILSSMGYQTCPLPTAILSAHSEYPDYYSFDLTSQLNSIIEHWKKMNLQFDALYSGYLASPKQIAIIRSFFDTFKTSKNFILVDPVLGDNHKLYPGMGHSMIHEMRSLCQKADVITPNLTEAALLLNEDLNQHIDLETTLKWCKSLSELGPTWVIITSAPSERKNEASTIAYNKEDGRAWRVKCDYIPASYPGTGDAFAAVITGSILNGDSLPIALDRAVHFINMGIKSTFGFRHDPLDGMDQEKVLHYLNEPLPYFKYELLSEDL